MSRGIKVVREGYAEGGRIPVYGREGEITHYLDAPPPTTTESQPIASFAQPVTRGTLTFPEARPGAYAGHYVAGRAQPQFSPFGFSGYSQASQANPFAQLAGLRSPEFVPIESTLGRGYESIYGANLPAGRFDVQVSTDPGVSVTPMSTAEKVAYLERIARAAAPITNISNTAYGGAGGAGGSSSATTGPVTATGGTGGSSSVGNVTGGTSSVGNVTGGTSSVGNVTGGTSTVGNVTGGTSTVGNVTGGGATIGDLINTATTTGTNANTITGDTTAGRTTTGGGVTTGGTATTGGVTTGGTTGGGVTTGSTTAQAEFVAQMYVDRDGSTVRRYYNPATGQYRTEVTRPTTTESTTGGGVTTGGGSTTATTGGTSTLAEIVESERINPNNGATIRRIYNPNTRQTREEVIYPNRNLTTEGGTTTTGGGVTTGSTTGGGLTTGGGSTTGGYTAADVQATRDRMTGSEASTGPSSQVPAYEYGGRTYSTYADLERAIDADVAARRAGQQATLREVVGGSESEPTGVVRDIDLPGDVRSDLPSAQGVATQGRTESQTSGSSAGLANALDRYGGEVPTGAGDPAQARAATTLGNALDVAPDHFMGSITTNSTPNSAGGARVEVNNATTGQVHSFDVDASGRPIPGSFSTVRSTEGMLLPEQIREGIRNEQFEFVVPFDVSQLPRTEIPPDFANMLASAGSADVGRAQGTSGRTSADIVRDVMSPPVSRPSDVAANMGIRGEYDPNAVSPSALEGLAAAIQAAAPFTGGLMGPAVVSGIPGLLASGLPSTLGISNPASALPSGLSTAASLITSPAGTLAGMFLGEEGRRRVDAHFTKETADMARNYADQVLSGNMTAGQAATAAVQDLGSVGRAGAVLAAIEQARQDREGGRAYQSGQESGSEYGGMSEADRGAMAAAEGFGGQYGGPDFAHGGPVNMSHIADFIRRQVRQDMARGGYVPGGSGGMDDDVPAVIDGNRPARLSSGEFVFDAATVAALGDGNNQAGARKLNQLRHAIRQKAYGHRRQPPKNYSLGDLVEMT